MGKLKIDRKEFLVGFMVKARKIYIEERNGRIFGKLELDFGTSAWVRDCLVGAAGANNSMVFWQRRLEFAIIFFQVLENEKGRFAILSLESFKERKTRIFIPEGSRGSGWRSLAGEISALLPWSGTINQKTGSMSQPAKVLRRKGKNVFSCR